MRRPHIILLILGCLFTIAAEAQTVADQSPPSEQQEAPRFEAGSYAALLATPGGMLITALAPRFVINPSQLDSIEFVAEIVHGFEQDGLNGLYILQYKRLRTARTLNRNAMFWT